MPIVVAKYLGDKITNAVESFSFPYINSGINREITSKDTLQDTLKV